MSSVNSVFLLLGSVIAAGFVLRKSGAVGENDYKIYFKLITTLIIPCLILSNFRTVELTPEYLSIFAVSYLFGMFLSALVYLLLPGKTRSQKGMAVLNFAGINVGFIGIPLAEALFGPEATPIMVAVHGGNAVTLYAFCVIHAQLYTEQGADWRAAGRRLATSPVLLALAAALLMAATGIHLPDFCYTFTDTITKINTPLSMLALGMTLDFNLGADERRLVFKMLPLRYLAGGLAAFALCALNLYPPLTRYTLVLFFLLPGAINCIAYCSEYDFHPKAAALFNSLSNVITFVLVWAVFGFLLPPL